MKWNWVVLIGVILTVNIANALGEVAYRTVRVADLDIFYREAGPKDAPTILLLHGLPSSSRMYQPLLESDLATQYHLIALDYPGFGHSSWPDPKTFAYTFDHLAKVMQDFTEQLRLDRYILFMQDYGGPVGFRMALAHPERVQAMIIQNAVSHEEGLSPLWAVRRSFWQDSQAHEAEVRSNLLSLEATRKRHVGSSPDPSQYDPDLWVDEYYFLNQPGQGDIQLDLFYDYQNNVKSYPKWQQWLRDKRPPLLVLWGRYDTSFTIAGGEAYKMDVPLAEVHILDAGHFALDLQRKEIIRLTKDFMAKQNGQFYRMAKFHHSSRTNRGTSCDALELAGEHAGEVPSTAHFCRINRAARRRYSTDAGADVDSALATLHCGLSRQQNTEHVHVEVLMKVLFCDHFKGCKSENARVGRRQTDGP